MKMRTQLYVASRASIPERSALWRKLRAEGANIVSSWIDEAGIGQTNSMTDLWFRITEEIKQCDVLLLYVPTVDDLPLKGAFIEAGMALALRKPVIAVIDSAVVPLLGSWTHHPLVSFRSDLTKAIREQG